MSDQHLELEGTATVNEVPEVDAGNTTAAAPSTSEPTEQAKPTTLDEAVAQAFKSHTERVKEEPANPKAAASALAETQPVAEKEVDPITGRQIEPIKAPNGWTPALREKWSGIDRDVQKFIIDRERDMSNKLNQTADERKLASQFKDVAAPYEALMRQFNTNAVDHAKELFTLSHTLNTGTPQVKAQVIYNLISHFKPDAQTLQQLFAGQPIAPSQAPAPQVNVAGEVEKALAARAEQEQQAQAKRDLDAFASNPKNEFFEDVRGLMGKIIDAELVTGSTLPELFANAYELACKQHPEIAPILAQRATPAPQPQVVQTQAAAKPVSSVKPSLGAGKTSKSQPKSLSMDDAVRAAMEKHGVLS